MTTVPPIDCSAKLNFSSSKLDLPVLTVHKQRARGYPFQPNPLPFIVSPQYFVLLLCIFLLEILAGVLAYIYYQQVMNDLIHHLIPPPGTLSTHRACPETEECLFVKTETLTRVIPDSLSPSVAFLSLSRSAFPCLPHLVVAFLYCDNITKM